MLQFDSKKTASNFRSAMQLDFMGFQVKLGEDSDFDFKKNVLECCELISQVLTHAVREKIDLDAVDISSFLKTLFNVSFHYPHNRVKNLCISKHEKLLSDPMALRIVLLALGLLSKYFEQCYPIDSLDSEHALQTLSPAMSRTRMITSVLHHAVLIQKTDLSDVSQALVSMMVPGLHQLNVVLQDGLKARKLTGSHRQCLIYSSEIIEHFTAMLQIIRLGQFTTLQMEQLWPDLEQCLVSMVSYYEFELVALGSYSLGVNVLKTYRDECVLLKSFLMSMKKNDEGFPFVENFERLSSALNRKLHDLESSHESKEESLLLAQLNNSIAEYTPRLPDESKLEATLPLLAKGKSVPDSTQKDIVKACSTLIQVAIWENFGVVERTRAAVRAAQALKKFTSTETLIGTMIHEDLDTFINLAVPHILRPNTEADSVSKTNEVESLTQQMEAVTISQAPRPPNRSESLPKTLTPETQEADPIQSYQDHINELAQEQHKAILKLKRQHEVELEDLHEQRSKLATTVLELEGAAQKSSTLIKSLKAQVRTLTATSEKAKSQSLELRAQSERLVKLKAAMTSTKLEIGKTEKLTKDKEREVEQLHRQLQEQREESQTKLDQMRLQAKEQAQVSHDKIEQLQAQLEEQSVNDSVTITRLKAELEQAQVENSHWQQRVAILEQAHRQKDSQLHSMVKDFSEKEALRATLSKQEIADLEGRTAYLLRERYDRELLLSNMSSQLAVLSHRVSAASEEGLRLLSETNMKLQAHNSALVQEHEQMEQDITRRAKIHGRTYAENRELHVQVRAAQQRAYRFEQLVLQGQQANATREQDQHQSEQALSSPFDVSSLEKIGQDEARYLVRAAPLSLKQSDLKERIVTCSGFDLLDLMSSIEDNQARVFLFGNMLNLIFPGEHGFFKFNIIVCGDSQRIALALNLKGFQPCGPQEWMNTDRNCVVTIMPTLDIQAFSKDQPCLASSLLVNTQGQIIDPCGGWGKIDRLKMKVMEDFNDKVNEPIYALRVLHTALSQNRMLEVDELESIAYTLEKCHRLPYASYMKVLPYILENNSYSAQLDCINSMLSRACPFIRHPMLRDLCVNDKFMMHLFKIEEFDKGCSYGHSPESMLSVMLLPHYLVALKTQSHVDASARVLNLFCDMLVTPPQDAAKRVLARRLEALLPANKEKFDRLVLSRQASQQFLPSYQGGGQPVVVAQSNALSSRLVEGDVMPQNPCRY